MTYDDAYINRLPPLVFLVFLLRSHGCRVLIGSDVSYVATYQLCHLKMYGEIFTYHFEFYMNLPQTKSTFKKISHVTVPTKKTHLVQLSMARWNTHHVPSMDPTAGGTTRWHGATASSYLGGLRLLRARLRARLIGGGPLGMVFFLYRFFSWRSVGSVGWLLYPRKKGGWLRGGYFMKMRVMGHIAFWVNKLYGQKGLVNVNVDRLVFFFVLCKLIVKIIG